METETAVALGALLVVAVLFLGRAIVSSQQAAARRETKRVLEEAWRTGRAEPMEGAAIGKFLVESLSGVAAVDYAKDPQIRRLTSQVLTIARERQDDWLSERQERRPQ